MVEKDVRSRAAADSSEIEISRLHRISSVIASNVVRFGLAMLASFPNLSCWRPG
jgi:hypothetical protein